MKNNLKVNQDEIQHSVDRCVNRFLNECNQNFNPKIKQKIRMTEDDVYNIVSRAARRIIKENFEDNYNKAREKCDRPCWGFEMKDEEGDWCYGDVTFDPTTMKMTCMGISITVDENNTVDQALETLYEELMNNGYTNEE